MAALVGYIVVAAVRIVGRQRRRWVSVIAEVILWLGLLLHLAGLSSMAFVAGALPVHTPGASIALLASAIALAAGFLRFRARTEVLSGVLISLAAVMLGTSMLLPQGGSQGDSMLGTVWFPIHALGVFVGMASFACAFVVSSLYLVVRKQLKTKQLGNLGRLPSLEGLDRLNTRFVVAGFLALTIGIAAGGAWAASVGGGSGLGPTVSVTLALWGWYAVAVLVRVVGRWRGRLAAAFSCGGFLGMVVSLGVVMTLLHGWH